MQGSEAWILKEGECLSSDSLAQRKVTEGVHTKTLEEWQGAATSSISPHKSLVAI